jgi:deazaflavin-dependent oxidoreductase (nitroreductase family)
MRARPCAYAKRVPIPPVDPDKPPSRVKRMLTPFALSKAGTWYGIKVAARADPKLMKWTRGRVNLGGNILPTVLLTVRGRKSGVERIVPLVYFSEGDDVILMASSFGRAKFPAWYHNITANPDVTLTAGGVSERYRATEVQGPDRDRLYELAKRVYEGYGVYEDRTEGIRHVPVLRLMPEPGGN